MGVFTKKTSVKDIHELKKLGDFYLEKKLAYEDQLIDAYNNKKLKSKRLIEEAEDIIKNREKKSKNKKDN